MAASPPNVVAVAYPMQGHINPMLHLCKRLASLGIAVTLVNTNANHERLLSSRARAGLPSLREQGYDIQLVGIHDGLQPGEAGHEGGQGDAGIQASLIAAEKMRGPFEDFLASLRDKATPIACILSDAFLGWTQDVADSLGLPRVALWASSTAYNVLNIRLPMLNEKGLAPVRDASILEDENAVIDFIPGVRPLHPRDLPSILQVESPADPGFKARYQRTRRLRDAWWVLANTMDELEHDAIVAMQEVIPNYAAVGPLLPPAFLGAAGELPLDTGAGSCMWPVDQGCLAWLDKQRPSSVVYVAFGSLASLSAEQMRELASGLEASGQPFLWVIRQGLAVPAGFEERTKDKGMVVQWAPQLQVLFHPSVGAFLSHCGWNSTLESVAMGVPIIGLPCIAEQSLNCKHACEDWNVGMRLRAVRPGAVVEAAEIGGLLSRFMKGEEGMELRVRARELREAARRAIAEGGASSRSLAAFVQELKERAPS